MSELIIDADECAYCLGYSRGPINRNAFFFLDKNNANSLAMFFGENRIVLVTSKEIQSY